MASPIIPLRDIQPATRATRSKLGDSKATVLQSASNELIIAVVGHVGSGTSFVAEAIADLLRSPQLEGGPYETFVLKARDIISDWARTHGVATPPEDARSLQTSIALQNLGDEMRKQATHSGLDYSAVARGLVRRIAESRAKSIGQEAADTIRPDGKRRAYILDSLRHPAEVMLLRSVYQDAFVLVGVVCESERRSQRLQKKYRERDEAAVNSFMGRDSKAKEKYGQRVSDAFHLSDYFIDNTELRQTDTGETNRNWNVPDRIGRLIRIVSHSMVVRPEVDETAMNHAHAAMMQSACLSRQVGAALVDEAGNLIATGTNEVPKAGGGVYGEPGLTSDTSEDVQESRCAYRKEAFCSNTREQNVMIGELIEGIPELASLPEDRRRDLMKVLHETKIGGLLEFSRAVHAEMDALLSAGRTGASTVSTRLFVTTYPCHYCARHIVTAGVKEVVFIEPYPKSLALKLHDDSITVEAKGEKRARGAVLFRPFAGVAPRLYKRAFLKIRELKDGNTGEYQLKPHEWGSPWHLGTISYIELEQKLIGIDDEERSKDKPEAVAITEL